MPKFVYLYSAGSMMPRDAGGGKNVAEAWSAYLVKLGNKVVDMGAPFGKRTCVGGIGQSKISGYMVVLADGLEEAVALTKGHPHLAAGGSVEVAEVARFAT